MNCDICYTIKTQKWNTSCCETLCDNCCDMLKKIKICSSCCRASMEYTKLKQGFVCWDCMYNKPSLHIRICTKCCKPTTLKRFYKTLEICSKCFDKGDGTNKCSKCFTTDSGKWYNADKATKEKICRSCYNKQHRQLKKSKN